MRQKFEIGDIVCLTFDETKRFVVTNDYSLDGKTITVDYFNEYQGKIMNTNMPIKYLKPFADGKV